MYQRIHSIVYSCVREWIRWIYNFKRCVWDLILTRWICDFKRCVVFQYCEASPSGYDVTSIQQRVQKIWQLRIWNQPNPPKWWFRCNLTFVIV